jgi:putative transposase
MVNTAVRNWINHKHALNYYSGQSDHFDSEPIRLPKPPGFKHDAHDIEITFVRDDIINDGRCLYIRLTEATKRYSRERAIRLPFQEIFGSGGAEHLPKASIVCKSMKQLRFKWNRYRRCWMIVIIYEQAPQILPAHFKNVMSVDIGLNNLCAITFRYGVRSYLINGRPLKCVNRMANFRIDQEQSKEMRQLGSSRYYRETEKIKQIRLERSDFIQNYLHQASALCIQLAIEEKCRVIVLGKLKGIKYGKTNRSFVQIPLLRFVEMIKYKAKRHGLNIVEVNEAYTSQTSAPDLENIQFLPNRKLRRIHRGAFITNTGLMINSDINGSLNILRLFLNIAYEKRFQAIRAGRQADLSGSIPELIQFIRDKGFVISPTKMQVLNKKRNLQMIIP